MESWMTEKITHEEVLWKAGEIRKIVADII